MQSHTASETSRCLSTDGWTVSLENPPLLKPGLTQVVGVEEELKAQGKVFQATSSEIKAVVDLQFTTVGTTGPIYPTDSDRVS
jgi:hypothetical protein